METENKQITAQETDSQSESRNGKITLDELNKKIIHRIDEIETESETPTERPKKTRKRMETIAEILRILMKLAGEPESAIAEQVAKCYAEIEE